MIHMSTTDITETDITVIAADLLGIGDTVAFCDFYFDGKVEHFRRCFDLDTVIRVEDGTAWFACGSGIEMNARHAVVILAN